MTELVRSSETHPRRGNFGDDFDNLFEGIFGPTSRSTSDDSGSLTPVVDVVDEESQYVVKAELPGVDRKDIDVAINDGVPTIKAERKIENEKKDDKGRVIRRESRYGNYIRSQRK